MSRGRCALVALLLVACSHPSIPPAIPPANPPVVTSGGDELRIPTSGAVSTLNIAGNLVSFCDARGLRQLEVPTGRVLMSGGACPLGEAGRASGPEVTVRTPELGPDDIVELAGEGLSFPIEGHARDWASDAGKVLVVATATQVLEIVPATDRRVTLSASGAARVAVGGGWAAWWDGAVVVARRL